MPPAAVPSIEIVVSSKIAKKCDIRAESTHFMKGGGGVGALDGYVACHQNIFMIFHAF